MGKMRLGNKDDLMTDQGGEHDDSNGNELEHDRRPKMGSQRDRRGNVGKRSIVNTCNEDIASRTVIESRGPIEGFTHNMWRGGQASKDIG